MSYNEPSYIYKIREIVKYIDGDTVDVVIDLGFDITIKRRVRLYGINTPEVRTRDSEEKKKGYAAKDRLIELCKLNDSEDNPGNLILKSYGVGKFGRVVGEIFNDCCNVNKMLVTEGHAEEVDY